MKLLLTASIAALLVAISQPSLASGSSGYLHIGHGYGHSYGHGYDRNYRHYNRHYNRNYNRHYKRHHRRHHNRNGEYLVGGILLGSLLTHSFYHSDYYRPRAYSRGYYDRHYPKRHYYNRNYGHNYSRAYPSERRILRTTRIIEEPVREPGRRLFRNLSGQCFEITRNDEGDELHNELPAEACDW